MARDLGELRRLGRGHHTGSGYECTWYRLDGADQPDFNQPYATSTSPARQRRVSGATVAAIAVERLPLPGPEVRANPRVGADQLVGIPTWLWVTNFEPLSVTAAVPGTTADLVATPASVSFDMGDGRAPVVMGVGAQFACQAPGTPYDVSLPSAAQQRLHLHLRALLGRRASQEFTVTATMSYSLAWAADTGQVGTLPTLTRSLHLRAAGGRGPGPGDRLRNEGLLSGDEVHRHPADPGTSGVPEDLPVR